MKLCGILLIFILLSCTYDPQDKRLLVINHTNSEIAIYWNADTIPEYPSISDTEVYLAYYSIKSSDSLWVPEDNANWPKYVENSYNNKLNLFIYRVDSIKKYKNIDTINARRIYKKMEYSAAELNRLNWRVVVKK